MNGCPPEERATVLYRPIGGAEFQIMQTGGFRELPPRLPEQPLFYPVLHEEYAIARDWNAKYNEDRVEYVARFFVQTEYLRKYPVKTVGASLHQEYWIPAEDLVEFNRHSIGTIEIIASFSGAEHSSFSDLLYHYFIENRLENHMEIITIDPFLDYFERIRERTLRVIHCIPHELIDWTYKEGKFTLGDLIRHLATIERYMYAENAQFKPSIYPGHGREMADGYDDTLAFLHRLHQESLAIFRTLTSEDLQRKCTTPGGSLTLWKWLRAMVEHEVHHRGQIYLYLAMLDIPTPPLYGLTAEEVLERSRLEKSESSQHT